MLTWQAEDGQGLEGTRLQFGAGGFRALGRLVRTDPGGDFTAFYRLVVSEGGRVERLSVDSTTARRERHLTMSRTEDGFWLLDTGSDAGGTRAELGRAVDVDLAHSPVFNTVPIRRLGLLREAGEHTLPMAFVSLPELEVREVQQHYRTVSVLDGSGSARVAFRWDEFSSELTVDADGVVVRYPGVAHRMTAPPASAAS